MYTLVGRICQASLWFQAAPKPLTPREPLAPSEPCVSGTFLIPMSWFISRWLLSPYCVPGILLGARELGGSWTQPLLSLSFRSSGGRNREIRCLENWSWELSQVRGSETVSGHWGPKDEPNVSRQREQHEQMARAHVCVCVCAACMRVS